MTISLFDLELLRLSQKSSIPVGDLPQEIADHFGWKSRTVCLSAERLNHILEPRHGVTEIDVLLIPFALQHGLLLQERDHPEKLLVCYQHPEDESRRFKGAMKVLEGGFEIWISTFHMARPRQTRSLIARSLKLRDHL